MAQYLVYLVLSCCPATQNRLPPKPLRDHFPIIFFLDTIYAAEFSMCHKHWLITENLQPPTILVVLLLISPTSPPLAPVTVSELSQLCI